MPKKIVKSGKEKDKREKKIKFEVEGDLDDLGDEEISVDVEVFDEPRTSVRRTLRASKSPKQKTKGLFDFDEESKTKRVEKDEEIKYLKVKASKPVSQIKKGDKMKVDSLVLEVDSHYVLIDHGKTKEMAIELFDSKTDKDYQLRYFSDQMETSMEFYELDEIVYNKKDAERVEW